jgi:hypothetical protein
MLPVSSAARQLAGRGPLQRAARGRSVPGKRLTSVYANVDTCVATRCAPARARHPMRVRGGVWAWVRTCVRALVCACVRACACTMRVRSQPPAHARACSFVRACVRGRVRMSRSHILPHSPTHPLTYWPTHLLAYSPTRLLAYSPTHLLACSRTHLLACSPTHLLDCYPTSLLTYLPARLLAYSPTHLLAYSPTHLLACSRTHLLACSRTHLLTHSATQLLTHPLSYSLLSSTWAAAWTDLRRARCDQQHAPFKQHRLASHRPFGVICKHSPLGDAEGARCRRGTMPKGHSAEGARCRRGTVPKGQGAEGTRCRTGTELKGRGRVGHATPRHCTTSSDVTALSALLWV